MLGEAVTLTTRTADGATYETQLWVVELDGSLYLRATSANADWLARLRAIPEVALRRGEVTTSFRGRAVDDASVATQVNRAMAQKYGRSDRLLGWLVDPTSSVSVRLEPVAGGDEAGSLLGVNPHP
jgi:hypothetical protein